MSLSIMTATIEDQDAIDLSAIESELRDQSNDQLRKRFGECYGGAARLIAEASVCIKLLKERGEDLSGIPMASTFLRVASGQILPEVLWKFIESPNRRIVERLPVQDQKRIAADPTVDVIEPQADRKYTTRRVNLTTAPPELARLAIGPEGIRTPEEQIAHLSQQKQWTAITKATKEDEPQFEPLVHRVGVRLSASELECVRLHAARAHITEAEMIRRFLMKTEAFTPPKPPKR